MKHATDVPYNSPGLPPTRPPSLAVDAGAFVAPRRAGFPHRLPASQSGNRGAAGSILSSHRRPPGKAPGRRSRVCRRRKALRRRAAGLLQSFTSAVMKSMFWRSANRRTGRTPAGRPRQRRPWRSFPRRLLGVSELARLALLFALGGVAASVARAVMLSDALIAMLMTSGGTSNPLSTALRSALACITARLRSWPEPDAGLGNPSPRLHCVGNEPQRPIERVVEPPVGKGGHTMPCPKMKVERPWLYISRWPLAIFSKTRGLGVGDHVIERLLHVLPVTAAARCVPGGHEGQGAHAHQAQIVRLPAAFLP